MHILIHFIHTFISIPTAQAAQAATDANTAGKQSITALLGIDWKLFLAQLLNFGVILFVLWKWVFGPVSKALTDRTEKIEKSVRQAKEIEEKLKETEALKLAQIEQARKEASQIVDKAVLAASQAKDEILKEAKNISEKLTEQTKRQLADEKVKLLQEVREEAATLVVMATEKIIKEKIDQQKDRELIKESLSKV